MSINEKEEALAQSILQKNQIIRLFNLHGGSLTRSRSPIDRDDSLNEDVNPIHKGTNEVEEGREISRHCRWNLKDQRQRRFSIGSKRWLGWRRKKKQKGDKNGGGKHMETRGTRVKSRFEKMDDGNATERHCCRWTPHGANVTRVNVPLITLINTVLYREPLYQASITTNGNVRMISITSLNIRVTRLLSNASFTGTSFKF